MNELTREWINECVNEWTREWMNERVNEWTHQAGSSSTTHEWKRQQMDIEWNTERYRGECGSFHVFNTIVKLV